MESFTTDTVPRTWHIEHRPSVESTQDVLTDWLAEGSATVPRDRRVVIAERQTVGRGRGGRSWESPPGGMWVSFSLASPAPPDPFVGLIAARAALESVRGLLDEGRSGVDTSSLALKWPNDLVAGERKWGGVLADAGTGGPGAGGAESCIAVGIGLNLEIPRRRLPEVPQGALPPTSIQAEFGFSPSPREALFRMLSRLDVLLDDDVRLGREHSRTAMQSLISTIGRSLRWRGENGESHVGTAVGLEPSGALRVRLEQGRETIFHSGQIQHLRALP